MSSSSSSSSSSLTTTTTTLTTRRHRARRERSKWTRCDATKTEGKISLVAAHRQRPKQAELLAREQTTTTTTSSSSSSGKDFTETKKEIARFETFLVESNVCTTSNQPDQAFLDSYSPPTAFDEMVLQNKSMESKGTMMGVVALITGSTVGAGILALPSVCAETGVVPSICGIVGTWLLLLLSALLLAEINVSVMRERDELRFEHGRGHSYSPRRLCWSRISLKRARLSKRWIRRSRSRRARLVLPLG